MAAAPEEQAQLVKYLLYSTKNRFFLLGRTKDRRKWRVLKFARDASDPRELDVLEDPIWYSEREVAALLSSIHDGNLQHGGLKFEVQADAVVGCFALLEGCYLLLVTKKRLHGSVCGRKVYGIAKLQTITLLHAAHLQGKESGAERRYKRLLGGLELTRDFFWSYGWPLWRTVQANLGAAVPGSPFDSMYVWNDFLTRKLRLALGEGGEAWTAPLIHGAWQQRSLAVLGRALTVTLIARRSRHFAGTRYRKRGVSDTGRVANEVEVEQVVDAGFDWRTGFPLVASLVQVRGSIPLYWGQDAASMSPMNPKPAIQLQQNDPHFTATRQHFQGLAARYGHPVTALNLVKAAEKRPRESILRSEFAAAVKYINSNLPEAEHIRYMAYDFKAAAKRPGVGLLADIAPVIARCLDATGVFLCVPAPPGLSARRAGPINWEPELVQQRGVLRTNCIDCLDRTNVAQFAAGLAALARQLEGLGLTGRTALDPRSSAATQLMAMYEQMGNALARQYGGSEAHAAVFQRQRGDWQPATRLRDKFISLRRAISNGWYDDERQDAMNLFLGHFQPRPDQPALWDLDSDHYLHSGLGRRSLLPSILEGQGSEGGVQGALSDLLSHRRSPSLAAGLGYGPEYGSMQPPAFAPHPVSFAPFPTSNAAGTASGLAGGGAGGGGGVGGVPRRRRSFPTLASLPSLFSARVGGRRTGLPPRMNSASDLASGAKRLSAAAVGRASLDVAACWREAPGAERQWRAEEARTRMAYTQFLSALEAQLAEASTSARRAEYAALASPALAVSLEGFADGRGGAWRACHGLVGARSFAEQELRAVAAQVAQVQAAF
ncbi:hypothetical protein WJX81_007167 [Elliptochloris bilobata]|uniref:SAC domain-containing protein n=1 Tax=Elliptochloris bilobata TaxID=381761 RepID=A0AAW1SHZ8_9CHLO